MKNKDLTIIYYSANVISEFFANNVRNQILKVTGDIPIISITHKPIIFGENICVDLERSYLNIYRQALIGTKKATTKYIALCEDDVFYSAEHFEYIPTDGVFAYDRNMWNVYTWTKPPLFSYKGRRNMNGLICERNLFIDAMEERFEKYKNVNDKDVPTYKWAEPGKYERQLGVVPRNWEFYKPKETSIVFSHPTELSFAGLGKRKKLGEMRRTELEGWGKIDDIIKLYK